MTVIDITNFRLEDDTTVSVECKICSLPRGNHFTMETDTLENLASFTGGQVLNLVNLVMYRPVRSIVTATNTIRNNIC